MLQLGGQGATPYFDAQKLKVVLVVGAGDAVGAKKRPGLELETQHQDLAGIKAQALRASRRESERAVSPLAAVRGERFGWRPAVMHGTRRFRIGVPARHSSIGVVKNTASRRGKRVRLLRWRPREISAPS